MLRGLSSRIAGVSRTVAMTLPATRATVEGPCLCLMLLPERPRNVFAFLVLAWAFASRLSRDS